MKVIPAITIAVLMSLFSCKKKESGSFHKDKSPKITTARGSTVSVSDILQPEVIVVEESKLKLVKAGRPIVKKTNENMFTAIPEFRIPFSGFKPSLPVSGLSFRPDTLQAIKRKQPFSHPEVVPAKDRVFKDINPYTFSSFGKLQGLKHNVIKALVKDEAGNIWIGTTGGGLTKYDGKSFTHFNENQGLLNLSVRVLMIDDAGDLWIGTEEGIYVYDGYEFSLFEFPGKDGQPYVNDICRDKQGNIWIALSNGMLKYPSGDLHIDGQGIFEFYTKKQGLPAFDIMNIFIDESENLWIATRGGGVSHFDGQSFQTFDTSSGLPSDFIESILQDQSGAFWFGTNGGGLVRFDGKYLEQFTQKNGFATGSIFCLSLDKTGNVWIGTYGGGLMQYDGRQFIRYNEYEGLNSAYVLSLLQDDAGYIWIGSDGSGLSLFQGNSFRHFTEAEGLLNNSVFSIIKDRNGYLWLGSLGGGISRFDGNEFNHYTEKEGLSSNAIYTMLEDSRGNLWMGTNSGGINKFDGTTFVHYSKTNGLSNDIVLSILEDRRGNLWFGTRGGVSMFAPDDQGHGGQFTNYTTKSGLTHDIVFDLHEDGDGNLWMATGSGVTCYDGVHFTHFKKAEGFSDQYVLSILEDNNDHLWFGTMGEGLFRFDGAEFMRFAEKEGLVNDVVLSLAQDRAGSIWIGTRFGLSKLDFSQGEEAPDQNDKLSPGYQFMNLVYEDGFLGIGCWRNSIYIDADQSIFIGSNDRLTLYNPSADQTPEETPDIQITFVELYNEPMDWVSMNRNQDTTLILGNGIRLSAIEFNGLSKWNNLPSELSLPHNNNFVSFYFVGVTTSQPASVRYQYRLDGLEPSWSAVTNRNSAHYGNLTPGRYTFLVKAAGNTGQWTQPAKYSFSIRLPWWETPVAYLMYLMILGYLAYRIHVFQKGKTLRRERERTQQKELEQAREIEKAYTELKSTQSQLIQSEKMASLGELTAGIAHEIQNPLNFVNNFSEVSSELIDEMHEELDKGEIDEAKSIASDIKQNLEKITHHGKRADAIVKGMLEHSRASSGDKVPTDINSLADEYLRLSYHGLRARDKSFNAAFETDFDPALPNIEVVHQDIGRVLLNLINNAFYAVSEKQKTPSGLEDYKPKVVVSTKNLGDRIEILVKDNGNGIPEEIKSKIFQPFFTTKPTGEGTGLGLSLSYDIVKTHGGELRMETIAGEGSAFIIAIPSRYKPIK